MSNTSFDPSIINEVIDKTDIVNVIKQRIPLKKKGHEWIGLCPFHQEKTPSFYVSERKQMFYCFGCHAGGNVINFITQHDHTPFVEALKQLAQLAHITLPQSQQNIDPQLQANKIKIASIMKIAQAVYHDQPQPQVIQKYLDARNINAESCQLFGLGYADEHSNTLKNTLNQQTLQLCDWINAGMNQSQKKTFRPLFFKRLMFPIHDTKGQIIAFGGRTLTAATYRSL